MQMKGNKKMQHAALMADISAGLPARDENGRKQLVNTKTITIFHIFLSETKSKTVTPETETISVSRKHQKRKFGPENTPVTVEI
jgi:hypothetical protein